MKKEEKDHLRGNEEKCGAGLKNVAVQELKKKKMHYENEKW